MSESVLGRILEHKRQEVAARITEYPLASFAAELTPSNRDFRAALAAPGRRHIFEVKKASPSRGAIRPDLDLGELLGIYERHADCISVLTDAHFFGGDREDLRLASKLTSRPLLRKDFIIDPYQVAEARWLGADAVLLIVAALEQTQLLELSAAARELAMDILVEIHDEAELDRALAAGADLLGINNRNLVDLTTDLAVTERLAPRVPAGVVTVSESGVERHDDLLRLAPHVDAFLVGSSILAAEDMDCTEEMVTIVSMLSTPASLPGVRFTSSVEFANDSVSACHVTASGPKWIPGICRSNLIPIDKVVDFDTIPGGATNII